MASVDGKDVCGSKSYINVSKKNGKIHIFTPEDASDVILTTKQAKQLVEILQDVIKQ